MTGFILGIDPGAHGAIAVLDETGDLLAVEDMPSTPEASGRTATNAPLLAGILAGAADLHKELQPATLFRGDEPRSDCGARGPRFSPLGPVGIHLASFVARARNSRHPMRSPDGSVMAGPSRPSNMCWTNAHASTAVSLTTVFPCTATVGFVGLNVI
jgi:hypothetical protein